MFDYSPKMWEGAGMRLKTGIKVVNATALLALVVLAGGYLLDLVWLFYLFIVLIFITMILNILFIRCPVCGRYLGRNGASRFALSAEPN